MAKDAGVSTVEFRKLAHMGPEGAELLFRRLEAIDLDPKEVGQTERRTLQDLEEVVQCVKVTGAAREIWRAIPKIPCGRIIARTPQRSRHSTRCRGRHGASGKLAALRPAIHAAEIDS